MDKAKTIIDVKLTYVPEASVGFTKTDRHFIAEAKGFKAVARGEYDAIDKLKRQIVDKLNEGRKDPLSYFRIEMGREEYVNYPPAMLSGKIDEIQHHAINVNQEQENEIRESRLKERIKKELGAVASYAYLERYNKWTIRVDGITRYSFQRRQTLIRTRTFKPNAKGEYNWDKIREAVNNVAKFHKGQQDDQDRKEKEQKTSAQVLKALGINEHSSMLSFSNSMYRVSFAVQTEEEVKKVIEALKTVGVDIH